MRVAHATENPLDSRPLDVDTLCKRPIKSTTRIDNAHPSCLRCLVIIERRLADEERRLRAGGAA